MLKTHRNGVESEEIDLFGGEMGEQAVSLSRPILDHDIEILDGANPGTHDSTSSVAENAEPPVFVRHITPHEPVTKEGTSVITGSCGVIWRTKTGGSAFSATLEVES